MSTLEQELGQDQNTGGMWGAVRSGPQLLEMLQQNRIRVAEVNNMYWVEVTRDDGGVGVYKLPIIEALNLFP